MTFATPAATAALAQAHPGLACNPLGATGLMVSAAGFGCYRVDVEVEEHHTALERALIAGVNLIDTSANYTDGNSERLVGAVLGRLISAGVIAREQVVVVTKAGYLQGRNHKLSQDRKQEGRPFPELLELQPGLEHCIHPEFLADQIGRSLERLGLESLDVFLLHNPEYFLEWAEGQGMPLEQARAEYHRRIGQAFAHLEDEVARGRVGCYGVSSNTFPLPPTSPGFTSLHEVWRQAQALGDGHHLRVIQFPCNLLEPGAVLGPNQPGGQTLLELATELGLGVLVNRPLNAMAPGQGLVRLADLEAGDPPTPEQVLEAVSSLKASEDELIAKLLPQLGLEAEQRRQLADFLAAAPTLADHWTELQGLEHWRHLEGEFFLPRIHAALQFIVRSLGDTPELRGVVDNHLARVGQAFTRVGGVYRAATARELMGLRALAAAEPDWGQAATLSQMALRALRSTTGVGSVLVGMRRPAYVADVLAELARPVAQAPRKAAWLRVARG
ncbi:MAG: aldo/keto reductase [Thermodesulfobacteriota bacterium]